MKKVPHWFVSVVAFLSVMGIVWVSVVGGPSFGLSNQGGVSLAPTWKEAMNRFLQERNRYGPGLERRLKDEWQKRVQPTRQPRVQELALTEAPGHERNPVWSPDRRTIAFSTNSVDSNGNKKLDKNDGTGPRFRIWLIDPDGNNARPAIPETDIPPVIPKGDELFPAWFADSGVIAFVISAAGVTDIYTANLRRSPVEIQQRTFGLRGVRKISVAPSGAEIAFERTNQIYLVALDTGAIRQLTTEGINRNPSYLPDGRILYESNLDPATNQPGAFFHIWVMRGDGRDKRIVTTGPQNDTEPAPIYFTHPDTVLGERDRNRVADFRVAFTSDRTGNKDIFLTDEIGTTIRQVSVVGNRTQEYHPTVEPFPVEFLKIERVSYVTTRAGNEDIYQIFSFDIFPPLLSDLYANPVLPKITPKINLPGDTITLEARVFDPECGVVGKDSGIDKVYAVFKSANDPMFLWALHLEGFPRQKTCGPPVRPGDQAAIAHEVDWFIANFDPDTGQDKSPPLVNTMEVMYQAFYGYDINRYWQLIQPYAIELFDDGTKGDKKAGDGIFTRRIILPNTPRDYYVDIIPFDRVGNFPASYVVMAYSEYQSMVMPRRDNHRAPDIRIVRIGEDDWLIANRQLFVIPALGYDNIVGCTSKPFTAEDHVLLVSDYACGQKWTTARSVELGNFQVGFFYVRLPDGRVLTVAMNYPGIPAEVYYFGDILADPYIEPGDPGRGVIGKPHAPFPIADRVTVWRTLCRGPIPDETLFLFLPRPFADPVTQTTRLHADRAVLWLSPYTGTLWVDKGTLEDPITQGKLARFLDRGGRLCIPSGQDLGWGLTINGTTPNEFLTRYIKASFSRVVAGYYGDYSLDLIYGYSAQRHKLEGSWIASGFHDWGHGFTHNEDTLASDGALIDPDTERHGTASGIELLGFAYADACTTYDPPLNPSFSGAGCENALVMDTVDVLSGAIGFYVYTQGGYIAATQYRDPSVDYRIVTFFFPFEAMNDSFKDTSGGEAGFAEGMGVKHTLMRYIMDFLRTASITGKVVDTQGNPLEGFSVRAQIGSLTPRPIIFGGALTQKDGSYEIIGLNTGGYDLEVSVPGWTSRILYTRIRGVIEDNATPFVSRLNDFTMTKLPPGSISGKVTEADGTTPIIGATVTAVIVADEMGRPIVLPPGIPSTYTTKTKGDGTYRIEGIPNATYDVTASAPKRASVTRRGIVVRPGLETTGVDFALPGEPGAIAGRVVDELTNMGIPRALVEVLSDATIVASTDTDARGEFSIPNIPVGTYAVRASAVDYKPATVTGVRVPIAGTVTVEIRLAKAKPGLISGRVTRPDGTPIGAVTVEVVRPATGDIVASAVTDPDFTIVNTYRRNYLVEDVPLGTYTVRVYAPGYTTTPVTNVVVEEERETRNVNFVLRAQFTFPAGVQLISVPYDYTNMGITPDQLLDTNRIVTWVTDPTKPPYGGEYVRFPTPPADSLQLGRGYFVKFLRPIDFTKPGFPSPTDQPFEIRLNKQGWWLIGNPFPFKVDWLRTKVRDLATGQTLGFREATLQGWVRDSLFALNVAGTGYFLARALEPFRGYWVRVEASNGVALLIDNTPTRSVAPSRATSAFPSLVPRLSPKDGWLLSLRLKQNGEELAAVQFGMASNASDGLDNSDIPAPPPLREWSPNWVTFGFIAGANSRSPTLLLSDIRSLSAKPKVFDLLVEGRFDSSVTLVWDNLNEVVPPEYRLMLVDPETGEHRYMRTSSSWTFNVGDGAKRLQVVVERRLGSGLRIVGARQESGRGNIVMVRFVLTEPALVEGRLVSLTGRLIQIAQPRKMLPVGENRLTLDGRSAGTSLPKGLYLLELLAYGEKGEQVRTVVPVRLR